ncbi:DUF2125 domain-containing protein [Wenxinia saemankumensis]|uniref:DUF2125 domain-containing protein n=1 Tax=Wenxinia saemankumensis TaxID=1447782 RepID=A0A1M6BTJ6_9RHOB|nr:DUF2125 domain-containing protein [Wenxinia saemankumensis]SHI52112.1 hypothetical protein SAMN05444417_0844 [Wenxinia saemankumensis]
MRALTLIVLLAAALYSGWWVLGRGQTARVLDETAQRLEAEGWEVAWDEVSTTGFPSRFDTTIDAPRLAAPEQAWTWSAPFLQILSLSYRPTGLILAFPEEQGVTIGGEAIAVEAEGMRASFDLTLPPGLELTEAVLESGTTRLEGAEWTAELTTLLAAIRRAEGEDPAYDLFARATRIVPPGLPEAALPPTIERLEIDALMSTDTVFAAASAGEVRPTALELRHLTLAWGETMVEAGGRLDVGPDGVPTGRIDIAVRNWAPLLDTAIAAGLVPAQAAPAIRQGARIAALGQSDLTLPLVFEGGRVSLGPIPLGAAPRF